ncbi:hypothetical protein KIN20_012971 [Parelaphostrongylus tenuis]|uniref:Uncharacterized protein n=1 Tax=Parelaphostrongylus tenuis TaxID=148309 RepID=A0AAD5QKM7_PARTN|nr:hypothetical protein KIN20_012971 [Parelaphostrongylus tenuis]
MKIKQGNVPESRELVKAVSSTIFAGTAEDRSYSILRSRFRATCAALSTGGRVATNYLEEISYMSWLATNMAKLDGLAKFAREGQPSLPARWQQGGQMDRTCPGNSLSNSKSTGNDINLAQPISWLRCVLVRLVWLMRRSAATVGTVARTCSLPRLCSCGQMPRSAVAFG